MSEIKVFLVVYERGGLAGAYVGEGAEELAHKTAEATKSVVVALPVAADYRTATDNRS